MKDNFLNARSFTGLDDLNAQGRAWLVTTANVRSRRPARGLGLACKRRAHSDWCDHSYADRFNEWISEDGSRPDMVARHAMGNLAYKAKHLPPTATVLESWIEFKNVASEDGVHHTMEATGLAVGIGPTVTGAAAAFGGSPAARAAIEETRFAADATNSLGRVASDYSGVHTGLAQNGGSDAEIRAPPPLIPAPVGERMPSESHPSLTAHQTAPNSFAVVDQDKGTISHHRGNIFTPQAAQATFNSHSARAKPFQAIPSPLPTRRSSKGNQSA